MVHTCGLMECYLIADYYRQSTGMAQKCSITIHDAAALIVIEQRGIEEIYTFD
jgi:hypothetical protein